MFRFIAKVLAVGVSMAAGQAAAASCTTPANVNALVQEMANGLNANRRANGLAAISYNQNLAAAAMAHACDMSRNGFFGHNGSNGSTVQRRVRSTGYQSCLVAENIAWGYASSEKTITGWMNSPGHRTNMLHRGVAEFGIGVTEGAKGPNWVLVLARGC